MDTIFDGCTPRDEVLKGDLRDEMFAARLKDVVEGTADSIYQDPKLFFENTFVTDGLRTLVREVVGRLSGQSPANSPFVRLETSFGGGKTHNLIALYHLAHGKGPGLPEEFIPKKWLPSAPWPTVGIVGSDMDPANGISHGELTTRTLWGEIAFQIGKAAGYKLVKSSDEDLVAPGTQVLDKLIGNGPALIMLDEVARYLRSAKAVSTANKKSDLAAQTVAFLMTLIEFAASKERVAVVLTLADSADAFGKETEELKLELGEAKRVSARQERVLTPTGETEVSKIVTHRLFKKLKPAVAEKVSKEYATYFARLVKQGNDLPQKALRAEYASEMVQDYPFHPEFLSTLNRKTSTIPNFQKTRGALRLLARVVRRLWEKKPKDAWLISVHHLDLDVDEIVNDLTSRLERPLFRSIVEADIASPKKGSIAHCQAIDTKWVEAGKPPFARRVAINVFLHSLTQGIATGVDPAELRLSVLQPGDDPQLVQKAISLMLAEEKGDPGTACWFIHWDGHRYRFKTEPSLEKVIQDELTMVGRVKAKAELDDRIRGVWKKGVFDAEFFPGEAVDLDDDAQAPKLAVVHYDAAGSNATAKQPPELVLKLFNHAGTQEGFRTYKNNVFFLVADQDLSERMVDVVQRHLAIKRIFGDSDRIAEFSDEQKKKLSDMLDASELEVRVAITRAYKHLYYPSADAPKSAGGLARQELPAQDQGEVEKDQGAVILKALKSLQKVLAADDQRMSAAYVKAKAWLAGQPTMSTEDLRKEFAKRIGLKVLLDVNQLKKTIQEGATNGEWVYFDAEEQVGYGKTSPAPHIQISEDALLYTLEEAKRVALRIKGEEHPPKECPLCRQDPCVCGEDEGNGGTPQPPGLLSFREEGPPAQVFQRIADKFHDAKKSRIGGLTIHCEGVGKDAAADGRALGLAIPQLGKGSFRVEQTMSAEFDTGDVRETFSLMFQGAWDRYKRVKQLTDAFGQEASKLNLKTVLRATFPEGLDVESDQYHAIRDIFTTLDLGKLIVDAAEAAGKEGKKA